VKPQSNAEPLDGVDFAPHPSGMDPKDRNGKVSPDSREAKLAAALRANLRRRKAPARSPEPAPTKDPTAD
jgi:hypothetical protein